MSGVATSGPTSKKELLWLLCREKTCCHTTKVIISGSDMWRIAQAMELMPQQYSRYVDAPTDAADAFQLEPNGALYQVVLDKRGEIGPAGAPCIFLVKTNDGHAQCGLGPLKPTTCQAFPATMADGLLRCAAGACTCRRWSVVDLDVDHDTALLNRMLNEASVYSQVVAAWNERIVTSRQASSFEDFCSYVIDVYTALNGGAS